MELDGASSVESCTISTPVLGAEEEVRDSRLGIAPERAFDMARERAEVGSEPVVRLVKAGAGK